VTISKFLILITTNINFQGNVYLNPMIIHSQQLFEPNLTDFKNL